VVQRAIEFLPAARVIEVEDGGPLRVVEVPGRVIEVLEVGRLNLTVIGGGNIAGMTAGEAISALRVVREVEGAVLLLDSNSLSHAHQCVGVALTAAANGQSLDVQLSGFLTDLNFSWTVGLPVYAGANGHLTQIVPSGSAAFSLRIGVAVSSDRILIQIQRSIILN
jgi:hypothetical protein